MDDGLNGYYIGTVVNPKTNNVDLSNNDSLYFPYKTSVDNCTGYWLASPSSAYPDGLMCVGCTTGRVANGYSDDDYVAFRPIIKLPTSVVNQ